MQIDGLDWMDWLHQRRAEEEEKRVRDGVSGAEWLRRASAHAQEVLAALSRTDEPAVAHDRQVSND